MNFTMNVRVKVSCNYCGARLDVAQATTNDNGISLVVDPHMCDQEENCPTCHGIKYIAGTKSTPDKKCPQCNGRGLTKRVADFADCHACGIAYPNTATRCTKCGGKLQSR